MLRVMRTQGLRSPHRGRQGEMKAHEGTIVTSAPYLMWGTDGVRVFTAEDGWVWTFAAVDHWNAECVGWHVCKVGSRFAALEPLAQGLGRLYGSVEADVARGLALRMDHGSQYLSDHFLNQLRYWGIHPSFSFVEEPETNGVVERWNRTLKEQAVYGRGLSKPRRGARGRRRVRRTLQPVLGASKSWRIARRSKRARNTSYAMPRSVNVCPRNRVRYTRNRRNTRADSGTRRSNSSCNERTRARIQSSDGGSKTGPSARPKASTSACRQETRASAWVIAAPRTELSET